MSTLKVTNVAHETSTLNTLVFDNGGGSGNGRVTTKGTIGEISAVSYASTITLDFSLCYYQRALIDLRALCSWIFAELSELHLACNLKAFQFPMVCYPKV